MRWLCYLAFALSLSLAFGTAAAQSNSFTVLSYHEVRDDVRDYPDPYAVDAASLVVQFEWLRGNGYVPVSLGDIIASRQGGKPLPAKAVLLTFDDAYLSAFTRVYPLLREFRFPALLGVVGSWIDKADGAALYGEKASVSGASFPSWDQLREMAASGLVEIASHSYNLHHGVPGNPQGNLQPAATARIYNAATASYESDASWQARVRADLARNSDAIERGTGRRPRAIVWPYGSYNGELVRIAGELGMPVALTLEDGPNTPDVPLAAVRRILVQHNPSLSEFAAEVRGPPHPEPVRVVQVHLDRVYHADLLQQERNLSALLDRVQVLKPTHVFVQLTTPLRVDLFNRVAWQLASRVDVKVFAVMPGDGATGIYEDLARHANFDGLLFMGGSAEETQRLATDVRRWRAVKIARWYADDTAAASDRDSDYVVVAAPNLAAPSRSPRTIYLLAGEPLARRMRILQRRGALNFGYAIDDFPDRSTASVRIARALSLRTYPLPKPPPPMPPLPVPADTKGR